MRADIVADGRFADCELTDTEEQRRTPSELQALAVLAALIAAFAATSAVLLRRPDVV
jgi:hypothetical protein